MNILFTENFPCLTAFTIDQLPPTDEESGVYGWDNYVEEIAAVLGCNVEDVRYLNAELLNISSEQEEFTSLQEWVAANPMDLPTSTNLETDIDREPETIEVEAYFYRANNREGHFFVRALEMQGDWTSYYFPVQFLTDDIRNFHR